MVAGTGALAGSFHGAATGQNLPAGVGVSTLFHSFWKADWSQWQTANRWKIALFDTLPDLTQPLFSSLSGEVQGINGYTSGGLFLNGTLGPTVTVTDLTTNPSGWGASWGLGNNYNLLDLVTSPSAPGFLFEAMQAGIATGIAPTVTTVGMADTGATTLVGGSTHTQFRCASRSISVFDTTVPAQWIATGGTIGSARYGVSYDSVSGFNGSMVDMLTEKSALAGTALTLIPDPVYGWAIALPG